MIAASRRNFLASLTACAVVGARAQPEERPRWFEALDREQGRHRFRFWGFQVYDAVLRVGAGFEASRWSSHPSALSLTYARDFKGADIARRSIEEIEGQTALGDALRQRWLAQLMALLPDVRAGDTLVGAYQPEQGLQFWRLRESWLYLGEVTDPDLGRRFLGIWLAPQTSEPAMRQALLGITPAAPGRAFRERTP
jgi:hypothetical protein